MIFTKFSFLLLLVVNNASAEVVPQPEPEEDSCSNHAGEDGASSCAAKKGTSTLGSDGGLSLMQLRASLGKAKTEEEPAWRTVKKGVRVAKGKCDVDAGAEKLGEPTETGKGKGGHHACIEKCHAEEACHFATFFPKKGMCELWKSCSEALTNTDALPTPHTFSMGKADKNTAAAPPTVPGLVACYESRGEGQDYYKGWAGDSFDESFDSALADAAGAAGVTPPKHLGVAICAGACMGGGGGKHYMSKESAQKLQYFSIEQGDYGECFCDQDLKKYEGVKKLESSDPSHGWCVYKLSAFDPDTVKASYLEAHKLLGKDSWDMPRYDYKMEMTGVWGDCYKHDPGYKSDYDYYNAEYANPWSVKAARDACN